MNPKKRIAVAITNMHHDFINSALANHTERCTGGRIVQSAKMYETVWTRLSIQISDECIMLVKRAIKDET